MKLNFRNYILIQVISIVSITMLYGQNQDFISIPTPNVASFGKFGEIPVNPGTGVPSIRIPIFTINDGSLSHNISLRYHASGIRVSEIASWVGLGWNLNVGGVVTRIIKGTPDEGHDRSYGCTESSYYNDYGFPSLDPYYFDIWSYFVDPWEYQDWNIFAKAELKCAGLGGMDTQPDLFHFSFADYSGSFFFDEANNPHLLVEDDIKIAVTYNESLPSTYNENRFEEFIITTNDGTKYYFGGITISGKRAVELTSSSPHSQADFFNASNWYLIKIESHDKQNTIHFDYVKESYKFYNYGGVSDSWAKIGNGSNTPIFVFSQDNFIRTTVEGLRLSTIETNNCKVKFIAVNEREDIIRQSASELCNRLDAIEISLNNTCQFKYEFGYHYSVSNTQPYSPSELIWGDSDTKRLTLDELKKLSCSNTDPQLHEFAYHIRVLPRRLTFDQDHWGYYNGAANAKSTAMMPPISVDGDNYNASGANRDPNPDFSVAGILTSITYPTGGYTNFTYEGNQYGLNKDGGGVRVASIVSQDNTSGSTRLKTYNYQYFSNQANTSGVIFSEPRYWYHVKDNINHGGLYSGFSAFYKASSNSIIPLQSSQGLYTGYKNVRVAETGNGYTQYIYKYVEYQSDIDRARESDNYPIRPFCHYFDRGKLWIEEVFNEAGTRLKKIENIYTTKKNQIYSAPAAVAEYIVPSNPDHEPRGRYSNYDLYTGYSHLENRTITDYLVGDNVTSKERFYYNPSKHSHIARIVKEYDGYEIIEHFKYPQDLIEVECYNNSNSVRNQYVQDVIDGITNTGFVSDWIDPLKDAYTSSVMQNKNYKYFCIEDLRTGASSDMNIAYDMIQENIVTPLEVTQWKNFVPANDSVLISATYNKYNSLVDGFFPLTEIDKYYPGKDDYIDLLHSDNNDLIISSKYHSEVEINYDNNKLVQIKKPGELNITCKWAYNNTLPIIKAENTSYAELSAAISAAPIIIDGASYGTLDEYLEDVGEFVSANGKLDDDKDLSWSNFVKSIQDALPDALITLYTYKPMVGITTETQPSGITIYYAYDGFNRLKYIVDQDGHILKMYEYHYATPTP